MLNKFYTPKHVYNYIYGTDKDEFIGGTQGDDWIIAGDGRDILGGGQGNDVYYGGKGNDIYYVQDAGDVVVEYADEGTDMVYSWLDYTLGNNVEDLWLRGDAVSGTGNGLNNRLEGNDQSNVLFGLDGNDQLIGGKGTDIMLGGLGDDVYWVDNTNDIVWEQNDQGNDEVLSTATYTLGANVETLWLLEGAGAIDGTGNDLSNHIYGNESNNVLKGGGGGDTLDGRGGKDRMYGGTGDDAYIVDTNDDVVIEASNEGYDTIFAKVNYAMSSNVERLYLSGPNAVVAWGNELGNNIWGNDQNNHLYGFDGMDFIWGGDGDDTIIGGRDSDSLWGEAGNDTFRFLGDFGPDSISDFKANGDADVIELDHNMFADFNAVQAHMTQEFGNSVMITHDDGNKILLYNTDIASLTAADFQFV